jgi:hypothetical protein
MVILPQRVHLVPIVLKKSFWGDEQIFWDR